MTKNKKVLLRMRRFFTVSLLSIVLYSCKPGIPKDIIQPVPMENILYDIHVIDGYASVTILPNLDTTKKVMAPYYRGVYKKHGVDSALYAKSLNYYYSHPKLLQEMYDHLTPKLLKAKEKALVTPLPVAPKPVPKSDSAKVKDSSNVPPNMRTSVPGAKLVQ